jgi:hypothetical protein
MPGHHCQPLPLSTHLILLLLLFLLLLLLGRGGDADGPKQLLQSNHTFLAATGRAEGAVELQHVLEHPAVTCGTRWGTR